MDNWKIAPEVSVAQSPKTWRIRARSHYKNIAQLLRQRGEMGLGVRASELYAHAELYGRSPRNRISELKNRDGWNIGSKPYGEGSSSDWFYFLRADNTGREYPTKRFDGPACSPAPSL